MPWRRGQTAQGAVVEPSHFGGCSWSLETSREPGQPSEQPRVLPENGVAYPQFIFMSSLAEILVWPLLWSAQRSRHNQKVKSMRECIAKSFMPWPGVCICSAHYGGRAIVLINQGGCFTDSLALASLSVMPSAGGWPPLNPKGCELLAVLWWERTLRTAQHSKGCDNSSVGEKRRNFTKKT